MSLETALDDERREVMNILEGIPNPSRGLGHRPDSPFAQNRRTTSPLPPVRSMLDIAGPAAPKIVAGGRHMGGTSQSVRSMLDTSTSRPARIAQSTTSSGASQNSVSGLRGARSNATNAHARTSNERETVDPNTDYQFSMLPSIQNQALPKRVMRGGKKQNLSSMASILQGQELSALPRGRDHGSHNSNAGIGENSKSPSSHLLHRSQSPGTGMLMQTPGKFVTDSGKVIDMNNAYRKLSNAALLKSGGELSTLATNTASYRGSLKNGEILSPKGESRLQKDYYEDDGNEDASIETSDDVQTGSSADEAWGQGSVRGRKMGRRMKGVDGGEFNGEDSEADVVKAGEGSVGLGKAPGPRKAKTLLAAAEEESEWIIPSQLKVILWIYPSPRVEGFITTQCALVT